MMIPCPVALGLILCDRVIVEEQTRNVSLISTFNKLRVRTFPCETQRFSVYSTLVDGAGTGRIKILVTQLRGDRVIYDREQSLRFSDRKAEVRVIFRVNECIFPEPGRYMISLLVDGEWVAQREIELVQRS